MAKNKKIAEDTKKQLNDVKKEVRERNTDPRGAWDELKDICDFTNGSASKADDYAKALKEELSRKDNRGFLVAGEGKDIKASVTDSKDFNEIDVEKLQDNQAYLLDAEKNEYKPLDADYIEGVVDKVIK